NSGIVAFRHQYCVNRIDQFLNQGCRSVRLLIIDLIEVHPEPTERLPKTRIILQISCLLKNLINLGFAFCLQQQFTKCKIVHLTPLNVLTLCRVRSIALAIELNFLTSQLKANFALEHRQGSYTGLTI